MWYFCEGSQSELIPLSFVKRGCIARLQLPKLAKYCAFRFHKELLAMLAIVALPRGSRIFPSFDNVFPFLQAIILTGRVLTNSINASTWSGH